MECLKQISHFRVAITPLSKRVLMYNLTKGNKFFLHVHWLTSQTHFNMNGCEPDSFWKRGNSAMACWRVLWLDITTFSDWFKNLATLCGPIRSKAKTNHALLTHVFPRFVLGFTSATWICFKCWLVYWIVYWSCLVFCHVLFTSKDLYHGSLTSLLSSSKLTLNVGSSRANRLRAFENCAKSF